MAQRAREAADNSFARYMKENLGSREKYEIGQMVETTVEYISDDTVFLQLGGKSEGILDKAEVLDKEGNLTVKVGDPIRVFFVKSQNGQLYFTRRLSADKTDLSLLEQAYKNKIPVEGVVEKEIKGGYEVKIGEGRAFCPYSQMGLKRSEDTSSWVGKHLTFIIQEYKDGGRNLIVSNRAIEEALQAEKVAKLKETLKEHAIVTGKVTSIQDFGAFVDLGAVQALLPVSEISRERVEDIRKVLQIGQEIRAEIIKLDWNTEKITLSMKSLQEDPWNKAEEKYPVGSKHSGKVVRITDYGAFVNLEPGLDGLVHVSELRGGGKYNNVKDAVRIGQTLTVQVLEVDSNRKRISLKPASSAEEEAISQKYMASDDANDTYNPFAALLKKK
ncbi:MAG TPA: S1 RNA-binding domain-containing protein [Termitinemataceae bacterium]|uniref:30S ribosomal protein S1 n=1 Tax=Treponema sp. J25 TaxID=2094121 RepID=UPI0010484B2E|nr:S1 RNA-binding domain-containing protein [Treponema sp. J25]TCW60129.1 30S ribosomal protein S1 [Treponema sp. J25]HOJ98103.1 S1 RNA-binding domain-containing protein [Termitinemataceae bacterium]HOM22350.1 S1 RNA-binding domain-containing protein [Termitinemataceae bacterium]HPP99228.1 S1 RNA-binding domain-containing protein [Termitinemataceae bacterium]